MAQNGFRTNLDAWCQGKATQDDVEAALKQELAADPQLSPAARSLIAAYREAGHIPAPFAERLKGIESGRAVPAAPVGAPLRLVPAAASAQSTAAGAKGEMQTDRPALQPAPFCGYVPGESKPGPAAPGEPVAGRILVSSFSDAPPPVRRPVKLWAAGGIVLALALIGAVWFMTNLSDRRAVDGIEAGLASPDPKIVDGAVADLSSTDEDIRSAVLGADGVKARVRAAFERRARSAFDPQRELFDYSQAQAILDSAALLLPDDEPLRQYKLSLGKMRELKLISLRAAFDRALAARDLLEDGGPTSLIAVRKAVAALDPADPLLTDGRVPFAFRDAAQSALAKPDFDLADRLVREGLRFAPGDPGLGAIADRIRREREKVAARPRR